MRDRGSTCSNVLLFLALLLQLTTLAFSQSCQTVTGPCMDFCTDCQSDCTTTANAAYALAQTTFDACQTACAISYPLCYNIQGLCSAAATACGDACETADHGAKATIGATEGLCSIACTSAQKGCIGGYAMGQTLTASGSGTHPNCQNAGSNCPTFGCGGSVTVQGWCAAYAKAIDEKCDIVSACGTPSDLTVSVGLCVSCKSVIWGRCVARANKYLYTTTSDEVGLVAYCKSQLQGGPPGDLAGTAATCPKLVTIGYGAGSASLNC